MVVAHLGRSIYPPNCMDNVPSFFDIGRKTHIASFSYHLTKSIQQSWCGPTGRCKLFSKYFIGKRIIDEHLQVSICFYIDSNTIWSLKLKTTSNTSLLIFIMQVLGAYEDVFMSHSSWFVYQATMRIYKHYNFNVSDPATSSKRTSFSSYPGKSCICFDLHFKQFNSVCNVSMNMQKTSNKSDNYKDNRFTFLP